MTKPVHFETHDRRCATCINWYEIPNSDRAGNCRFHLRAVTTYHYWGANCPGWEKKEKPHA